jgi:hypothetical protein
MSWTELFSKKSKWLKNTGRNAQYQRKGKSKPQ